MTTSRRGNLLKVLFSGGFGLGLYALATFLLFATEQSTIDEERGLAAGAKSVKTAPLDHVDPALNKKLVHIVGPVKGEGPVLADAEFGITRDAAVRLTRRVTMLQWEQYSVSKRRGPSETRYRQTWSEKLIDSSRFEEPAGHSNPKAMAVAQVSQSREKVAFGAYRLPAGLTSQLPLLRFVPTPKHLETLPEELKQRVAPAGDHWTWRQFKNNDSIGDLRIWWEEALPPTEATVVACQIGDTFGPFNTGAGLVMELRVGRMSPDAVLGKLAEDKASSQSVTRIVAIVMFAIGLAFLAFATPGARAASLIWVALAFVLYLSAIGLAWVLKGVWLGVLPLAAVAAVTAFASKQFSKT